MGYCSDVILIMTGSFYLEIRTAASQIEKPSTRQDVLTLLALADERSADYVDTDKNGNVCMYFSGIKWYWAACEWVDQYLDTSRTPDDFYFLLSGEEAPHIEEKGGFTDNIWSPYVTQKLVYHDKNGSRNL